MNDDNVKTMKMMIGGVLALLIVILGTVIYTLLKPPVVTQATINSLINSTQQTQQYVKELRDLAMENRVNTQEDNNLFHNNDKERNSSYEDLYHKYGINAYAPKSQKLPTRYSSSFDVGWLQFEAQSLGRQ